MKLKAMYSFLSDDLAAVEEELERTVRSECGPLGEAALHLLQAGGKRIRPVFVLLSARFGRYDFERIKHVAVALELIHMASLVHDDVIDDADVRRGRPTIKARWSNRFAMYTGDYLFARSLERMAELDSPVLIKCWRKRSLKCATGKSSKSRINIDLISRFARTCGASAEKRRY
ncbi:Heptaprenyl diphosphate synthase component 2 [Geobacillus sp. BCO2]|nr:Heptaprenyl diphosphate synthase component 2 [Geobacillus sp. BCO2]